MDFKSKIILISGPTASGKSNFAIRLAKKVNGEIINADSMQVYKQLKILSARPYQKKYKKINHHLYGFHDVKKNFSTGDWLKLVFKKIHEIKKRKKTPILVGGTGLYFKALTDGLVKIPNIPVGIRNQIRDLQSKIGQDNFYKKDLLNDKKELSEHLMLLDLGRNDTGKVSKINTVKVTESFKIEKYSHVMHIVSNVQGEFNKKFSKFDTLLSGFPAGTVSGAPKIRAMEIIDELETTRRKVYAGGIGYFSANGDFDTCIALRTAISKNNKLYVQSGAGIVADSKPNNEYKETINKAKALLKALE